MKRYMRVKWHHNLADEPVELLSEVDAGVETRKIEIYRDGRMDYAGPDRTTGNTILAEGLMPTVGDLSGQGEFAAQTIDQSDFESAWRRATKGSTP